jgi:hypothetical protein
VEQLGFTVLLVLRLGLIGTRSAEAQLAPSDFRVLAEVRSAGATSPARSRAHGRSPRPEARDEAVGKEFASIQTALARQGSIVSIGLTVVALLFGVVGLLLHLYTFFTTIRPAPEAVRKAADLDAPLTEKFNELLSAAEVRRVETLLERLESPDSGTVVTLSRS